MVADAGIGLSGSLKILMVTRETPADRLYGLGRSLQPLIEEFRQRGIAVDYVCQGDLGVRAVRWQRCLGRLLAGLLPAKINSTDISTLIHVLLERVNMGRVAAKLAVRGGYSHVHCHDPVIAAGLRFFSRFYPGQRPCWGLTEHGYGCYAQAIRDDGVGIGQRVMRGLRAWERRTLMAACWVIAPTRSCIEQIARDLGVFPVPANWRHVYHARPELNHYRREEARRLLGWGDENFYVLGVGRIAPVKQFPLLIEACARVQAQKSLQLVILGEGNYRELQALGNQAGLIHEILFATTDDIGLYLHAADLYVSTSISESFGLANLEAMAAGTAAICSAVGGVPEVMGDGAVLVAPALEPLADALQRLLDDEDLREKTAQQGCARAETWPDIREIADNYEKIYRQATASQNCRTGVVPAAGITGTP